MSSFPPKKYSVGTTGVVILSPRNAETFASRRKQYQIIFPSTAKVGTNTGTITIGIGAFPASGTGSNQHVMSAGEQFGETTLYTTPELAGSDVTQDTIYAIASTSGQIIEVYEVV